MLNIIYSEFLKLKKSYILIIVLISGALIPSTRLISNIMNDYSIVPLNDRWRFFQEDVFEIDRMSVLMVYIIIFCLIAAYVFSREYTDKTSNILYTYPVSKEKIFLGKFITIYINSICIFNSNFNYILRFVYRMGCVTANKVYYQRYEGKYIFYVIAIFTNTYTSIDC